MDDEKQLSVYFNPSAAETVGKIEWVLSDELNGKIELTPSRDTLSCNVKLIEDMGTDVLSGKIIANPLDNEHENILSGEQVFNCFIGKEIINKVKNAYIISDATDPNYNDVYYLYNKDEVEADSSVYPIYSTVNDGELSGNIIWCSNYSAGLRK